jgi:hypothetical protein
MTGSFFCPVHIGGGLHRFHLKDKDGFSIFAFLVENLYHISSWDESPIRGMGHGSEKYRLYDKPVSP